MDLLVANTSHQILTILVLVCIHTVLPRLLLHVRHHTTYNLNTVPRHLMPDNSSLNTAVHQMFNNSKLNTIP